MGQLNSLLTYITVDRPHRGLSHSLNIQFIHHNSIEDLNVLSCGEPNTKSSFIANINLQELKESAKSELIQIDNLLIWNHALVADSLPIKFLNLILLQSLPTKVTWLVNLSHPTFLFLQRLQLLNPMPIAPNLPILYSRNSLPKVISFLLKSPQLLTQQNWVKSIQLSHP